MNKNLYRLVFNQARGLMMAVAEIIDACGRGGPALFTSSHTGARHNTELHPAQMTPIAFATKLVLGAAIVIMPLTQAQIVAHPGAPRKQQSTVLKTANGVLQVNIQTPSAAGVSRNTYSQFDVPQQGAILNNSRASTQTQLGGWVLGNPWLATGGARVILNEINSSNPSQLQGNIEVAGQHAQVVIANPAGVTCDGCGFINASRTTLTTGIPIINGGNLDGYLVQRGAVSVQGKGMDASGSNFTEILARAVQANAGIWAKELKITAGAYQIDAVHGQANPVTGTQAAPAFAIDVSQLGGMYAGKIALIGTEAGVGVRNAGHLGASGGDLVVMLDGRLENAGSMTSTGQAKIDATAGVINSGTLYAKGQTAIHVRGNIGNSGLIAAQENLTLFATGTVSHIESSKDSVLGAGIQADGSLSNSGNLDIAATETVNAHGKNLAGADLIIAAQGINLADSQTSASKIQLKTTVGDVDLTHATISAATTLFIEAKQTLRTDKAVAVGHQLNLTAHASSNIGGELIQTGTDAATIRTTSRLANNGGLIASAGDMALITGDLDNQDGTMQTTGAARLAIDAKGKLDNGAAGKLSAGTDIGIAAHSVNNTGGQITAGGALDATAVDGFANVQGIFAANGDVTVNAANLDNTRGSLGSAQGKVDLSASTGAADNTDGRIEAAKDITFAAKGLINAGGIITGDNLRIDARLKAFDNTGGTVDARSALTLHSGALDNNAGVIQAAADLAVDTHSQKLFNMSSGSTGGILGQRSVTLATGEFDNSNGFVGARGNLNVTSQAISNTQGGVFTSEADIALTGAALNNRSGQIQAAGDISIVVGTGTVDSSAGLVRSGKTLDIRAGGIINTNTLGSNQGLEGRASTIAANAVDNRFGAIRADISLDLIGSGAVSNQQGLISAGGSVNVADAAASADSNVGSKAQTITNTGGTLIAGQQLVIDSASLTGDGKVLSQGDLTVTLTGDYVHTGELQASGRTTLNTLGSITNHAKILGGTAVNIAANSIDNAANGEISARQTTIVADNTLTNRGLIDGNQTRVAAGTIHNIGTGRMYADHLAISAVTLNNDAETAGGVTRAGGIGARTRLDIGAATINNREHALIFSAGTGSDSLNIGGSLDANWHATGQAGTVNNNSATIESLGGLAIASARLNNTNEHFSTQMVRVAGPTSLFYIQPEGSSGKILGDNFTWYKWSRAGFYRFKNDPPPNGSAILGQSPVPRVGEQDCTGDERNEVCTRVPNADYPSTDAAWGYFGVSAPLQEPGMPAMVEPAQPAIAKPTAPDRSHASACDTGLNYDASVCTQYNNDLAQYNIGNTAYNTAWTQYNADRANYDAAWSNYYTARDAWRADSDAKYAQLDARIDTYNAGFDGRKIKVWTQYEVTRTESEIQVGSSDPGQILSGGAMRLQGSDLVNDKSRIIAGGALTGDLGNLRNIEAEGQRVIHEEGTSEYTKSEWHGGLKRYYGRNWYGKAAYLPADEIQPMSLAVTEQRDNASPAGTGTHLASLKSHSLAQGTSATGAVSVMPGKGQQVGAMLQVPVAGGQAVRTTVPDFSVPSNSLFSINPDNNRRPLIETDARFADYRQWLGSDYMLAAMAIDPAMMQKRLGDGFYEQKLIREQVATLTGRRFLDGYRNDETQYAALMDNAVTFARAHQLRPGVSLTAQQMAQLTSDIVWLVERDVTLPDGKTTRALVPQVYVKVHEGDLNTDGTLIAGESVDLRLGGDLHNNGTIAGRQVVRLDAANVYNLGGRIAGADTAVAARIDFNNIGGTIQGIDRLAATAGRDLNVATTIRTQTTSQGNRTEIDRVAGLYVTGNGATLIAAAGRDVNLKAAAITNTAAPAASQAAGDVIIFAGNNLTLDTVAQNVDQNIVWNDKNYRKDARRTEAGTIIRANGDIRLQAGNDLTARAASVTSEQGELTATAGRNVELAAGEASRSFEEAHQFTSKSFLKKKTTERIDALSETTALATTLSGDSVTVLAGGDMRITGSNVAGTQDVLLAAQGGIAMEAATETVTERHFKMQRKDGLFGTGGVGVTYGSQAKSGDTRAVATNAAASTVGSTQGDITIQAGTNYRQVRSHVIALDGGIDIDAQRVDIVEAQSSRHSTTENKFRQSGVTVALSSPVITAVQTASQMKESAGQTSDARMKVLAAATAAVAAKSAYDAITSNPGQAGGINLNLSIGASQSQHKTERQSSTAAGSTVLAGTDIAIRAAGAKQDSDLTVQGSTIQAGNNVSLHAEDALSLLAAKNTDEQHSSNKSSSGSLGISFGTSGFAVTASASKGRGNADGKDITWTNTQVDAGNRLGMISGGDTILKGAVASGEQVTARVGGSLAIASLQDTSVFDSKQTSAGASVAIGAGISGSVSAGKSRISSDYASVTGQSGIQAGDDGFQIEVRGNTDLKGAVIASSQAAIDADKNAFDGKGPITQSDITNTASYSGKGYGINLSNEATKLKGVGAGIGSASGDQASVTKSGIGVATETDSAGTIVKIFDADKVQKEIDAQVTITQSFTREAHKAVNNYTEGKRKALQDQLKATSDSANRQTVQAQLKDLDLQERALNILIGAVTGTLGSTVGKEALSAAASEMRQMMIEDSKKFVGVTDGVTMLDNISGPSAGVRGDGVKVGGTRVDLDGLCGRANERCVKNEDGNVKLNEQGQVQFDSKAASMTLAEYLQSPEGKKLSGPTGGIQGAKGTLFGVPYEAGGWQDQLIEAFSGTHDTIGGKLSGLYDEQGNAARERSKATIKLHDTWSATGAIVLSTPFAVAELLPSEVWQAISLLLKAAK